MRIMLSFDVEEHDRIEAAAGLAVPPTVKAHYRDRLESTTRGLLEQLSRSEGRARFFIVGKIAEHNPGLVRAIHRAGHEVASHGWEHRRRHAMKPEEFRWGLPPSVDALEQVAGTAVVGYRAPTFSVVPRTSWSVAILAEAGMAYDSSIY